MKKCTISLVLIAIVSILMVSVQAESIQAPAKASTHYALLAAKEQAILPDVSSLCWASENGLFFLDSGLSPSLFHWVLGQNEVERISEIPLESFGKWKTMGQETSTTSNAESIIFSLPDGLFGFVLKTGEIKHYVSPENEWVHIGTLLVDNEFTSGLDAEMIKDVIHDGGFMYFLISFPRGNALLQLDLSTASCTILPDTNFDRVEPHSPGMLLVSLNGNLHAYDPHAQTRGKVLAPVDPLIGAFSYDQASDRLLFVWNGDIYQKYADTPMELIRVTELRNENPSWYEDVQNAYGNAPVSFLLPLGDGLVAYRTGKLPYESAWGDPNSFLYVIHPEPIVDAIKTLHIASAPSVATAFYQLTHPNVRIEHCIADSIGGLQGADHFPDVFSRSAQATNGFPLHAKELMDLSQSPAFREIMNRYDSKVLEAIRQGDKIVGLPWSLSLNTLDYDKEKWDSIGLPEPPKTVDALFALINMWDEHYADQYPNQPLLGNGGFFDLRYGVWTAVTEAYITEYASSNAPVNFDTEEYRVLVQRIIDMPEVKYAEWDVLLRFFRAFDPLNLPFTQLDWKDGYAEYTSISPLMLSDAKTLRIRSDLLYFCIAQDAQSPELALDFVQFLAEFQTAYHPEIGFMMTGGAEYVPGVYDSNPPFQPLSFVGMTSEGLSVLPHIAQGGFISEKSLNFYESVFPFVSFDISAVNPAYFWDHSDMRLPWPTDEPNGDLVCTVDELIAEMNRISAQNFLY